MDIPKSMTDSQISTSSQKSNKSSSIKRSNSTVSKNAEKPGLFSFFRTNSFRRKVSTSLSSVVQLARDQLEPMINYSVNRSTSNNQNLNTTQWHGYIGTEISSHSDNTYAHASMRGRRPTQEDAYAYHSFDTYQCYGIFDGHGSSEVSQACAKHLFRLLEKNIKEAAEMLTKFDPSSVIQKTIKQLDELLYTKLIAERYLHTGTTAVCIVYDSKYQALYFANLGDSRGILIKENQLVFSTVDHKPEQQQEYERIINIGGQVVCNRVMGALAVSRALGDFNLKAKPISPNQCSWNPDNLELVLSEAEVSLIPKTSMGEDMTICLACDGVFDVCENEEVTEFVAKSLAMGRSLEETAKRLVQHCFDKKSTDNISVMLIRF